MYPTDDDVTLCCDGGGAGGIKFACSEIFVDDADIADGGGHGGLSPPIVD